MIVNISPGVRIQCDATCFTLELEKPSKKNEGETVWRDHGFYPTFEMALKACLDKQLLNEAGIGNAKTIMRRINEMTAAIDALSGGLSQQFNKWLKGQNNGSESKTDI